MAKAKNLPKANPIESKIVTHAVMGQLIKAKYIPRAPKDGEYMMVIRRPQIRVGNYGTGTSSFLEYAAGDYITTKAFPGNSTIAEFTPPEFAAADMLTDDGKSIAADYWDSHDQPAKAAALRLSNYVVVLAKDGYTRMGEGYKVWEQILVVRLATEADRAAVADQIAAAEAETKRVMDGMMNS